MGQRILLRMKSIKRDKSSIKKIIPLIFLFNFFFGCSVPKPQIEPTIIHNILENRTVEEAFNDCLGVLYKKGHVLSSASLKDGFIHTNWFYFKRGINSYRYRLIFHIFELEDRSTAVAIKSSYQRGIRFSNRYGSLFENKGMGWLNISPDAEMKKIITDFFKDLQSKSILTKAESEFHKPSRLQRKDTKKAKFFPSHQEKKSFVQSLGFKLTGGYSCVNIGDLNTWIDSWNYYKQAWASHFGGSVLETMKNIHNGYNIEGKIFFDLSHRWFLSFGGAYIYLKNNSESPALDYRSRETFDILIHSVKVYPLKIGLYYSLPIIQKLSLSLNAGVGYYLARISNNYRYESYDNSWTEWEKEMDSSNFGVFGGFGIEYEMTGFLSLVFEVCGQYAKISSFQGTRKYKNSSGYQYEQEGMFYIWEELQQLGIGTVVIFPYKPESALYRRNIREFTLDLSGLSLMIGIKIRIF
jgi:hypothetical protein